MKTPLKAIKAYCLDCCCGSAKEVKLCPNKDCELYRFRLGSKNTVPDIPEKSVLLKNSRIKPLVFEANPEKRYPDTTLDKKASHRPNMEESGEQTDVN